jgi:hypothetical protein
MEMWRTVRGGHFLRGPSGATGSSTPSIQVYNAKPISELVQELYGTSDYTAYPGVSVADPDP